MHVDVKVVTMAVTVRDKHGAIVPSLTRDDFDLQDDNHPQVIKYFNLDTNLPLTLGLLVDSSMSQRNVPNPMAFQRSNYVRVLSSYSLRGASS